MDSFRKSDNYVNYKFNKDELDIVKIDITFLDGNYTGGILYETPIQQSVDYIKNSLVVFPEIRPLMHVMKRLLQVEKLNSTFNGNIFY